MPSFVPKEAEVDLAYRPGTIQYLRRLEKEKLERMKKEASASPTLVDNSSNSVDTQQVKNTSQRDKKLLGDERLHKDEPLHVASIGLGDKTLLRDESLHDSIELLDATLSPDAQLSRDTDLSHYDDLSHNNKSSHDDNSLHNDIPSPNSEPSHNRQSPLQSIPTNTGQALRDEISQGDSSGLGDDSLHNKKLSHQAVLSHKHKLSHDAQLSHKQTRSHRNTFPKLLKLPKVETLAIEASPVHITNNFAFRDRDVIDLMSEMTGDEWKVYCYLLSQTHEKWVGETHCWTSHHVIKEETGLGCRRTVGLVLESLQARGYILRTFTGNKTVKASQYRVFLPCELPGYDGTTTVSYTRRK